ncbi:TetR/AcrR family transcriptional regulator [Clostridiaceae bacterium M8S5]|nr:TetR/AcrR family transcriptional regulator [Clostridiaceae bacterium M8S5]
MKKAFFRLPEEKKSNLVNVCLKEFSKNTYNDISLDNITAQSKISKEEMFEYIDSKKDLYVYVIYKAFKDITQYQSDNCDSSIRCYFERMYEVACNMFNYYRNKQLEFKVMMNAFYDISNPCFEEIRVMKIEIDKMYEFDLAKNINWSQYNESKENIIKIAWFMIEGYNLETILKMSRDMPFDELEEMMSSDLRMMIDVIKKGAIKK